MSFFGRAVFLKNVWWYEFILWGNQIHRTCVWAGGAETLSRLEIVSVKNYRNMWLTAKKSSQQIWRTSLKKRKIIPCETACEDKPCASPLTCNKQTFISPLFKMARQNPGASTCIDLNTVIYLTLWIPHFSHVRTKSKKSRKLWSSFSWFRYSSMIETILQVFKKGIVGKISTATGWSSFASPHRVTTPTTDSERKGIKQFSRRKPILGKLLNIVWSTDQETNHRQRLVNSQTS